jgi:catechol 2,3-dioxygenase-like lactoylglutathione lyase family enzyme
MIGYVTIGTNDLDKARAYYDALFGSIGAKRLMELPARLHHVWPQLRSAGGGGDAAL